MPRRTASKAPDVFETLVRLGADPMSGVHLRPASKTSAIKRMQVAAKRDLGAEIPDSFVRLLRITNGVQINCAYFKEAENIVPENLDIPRPEIIVLGNEGNMAEHVFDKRNQKFHTIDMGDCDERLASYTTFENMLLAVMREQQVL
jgi:hypothetical protein